MAVSYKKLWKLLIDKDMKKKDLSQMQALGVDLATIQSLVGHADVDMTKHYLHVQDPVRLNAISMFDNAFFKNEQEVHRNIIEFVKSS